MTSLNVYEVHFDEHVALFIDFNGNGNGELYHVVMDTIGYETKYVRHETRANIVPKKMKGFVKMELKGRVLEKNFQRISYICDSLPVGKVTVYDCFDWINEVWDRIEEENALDG